MKAALQSLTALRSDADRLCSRVTCAREAEWKASYSDSSWAYFCARHASEQARASGWATEGTRLGVTLDG